MIPVYILAAGAGTRMFPYGELLPKALMPLGGKPFVRHIVDRLPSHEYIPRIGVLEDDLDLFRHEFRDTPWVEFVTIPRPRGTAGILADHIREEEKVFAVWYGDCLIDEPLDKAASLMTRCDAQLVVNWHIPTEYGILDTERRVEGLDIVGFQEHSSVTLPFWTGVGVFKTVSILPHLSQDKDLAHDVFPEMLAQGYRFRADVVADYFDIGTTQAYLRAKKALKEKKLLPGLHPGPWASLNLAGEGGDGGR